MRRKFDRKDSGQLLIVAALAIAILTSASVAYVYELSKEANIVGSEAIGDFILSLKHCSRNAMINSLANISNGGEKAALATNLRSLCETVRSLHKFGFAQLDFSVLNNSAYDSGIQLSWGLNGSGVSSAFANFTLKVESTGVSMESAYAFNISTAIVANGNYTRLTGNGKQVNLTCIVYNEDNFALAKDFNISYELLGSWRQVNSSNNISITDYGNGKYSIVFFAEIPSTEMRVLISAHDMRDVFVQASLTCYEA